MGLKATDPTGDDGGAEAAPASAVACSICLDVVAEGGDRSTAKLQCGHQFHLDCIGSAFNAKGTMQCPNCRKIEKGNWLYSNSYRYSEFSMEDWPYDDDLYDLNYPELPYGIHWCPYSRVARVPTAFEEGDSLSIAYHDLLGHHAVFPEHPANSSSSQSCPYLAYFHPLQPSSSSGSQVPIENALDGTSFHHPWGNLSGHVDAPTSHAFPTSDLYYHRWDSHSPPFSHPNSHGNGLEQESVSSGPTRAARLESQQAHPRSGFMHPFVLGHGSNSRASSSAVSSLLPPYITNSRGHIRVHELHASYQHPNTPGLLSGPRRSSGMRGMPPSGPTSSPPEPAGFFLLAPPAATSRSTQDVEANGGSHFYAWERDRFAPFPLLPVDRDLPWWGPPPSGSSDSSNRSGFWPHHSSERSSSQSRPPHTPRMHPFI